MFQVILPGFLRTLLEIFESVSLDTTFSAIAFLLLISGECRFLTMV